MTDDKPLYVFRIEDADPETLPLPRMLEYYGKIGKLVGHADHFYLTEVAPGSHVTVFAIDRDHKDGLDRRLRAIIEGRARQSVQNARNAIDVMLQEDGKHGEFFDRERNNVISFPGGPVAEGRR